MVHAKAFVADTEFALTGTANLDVRSFFLNFEVASCFYSPKDVRWLTAWMDQLIEQATLYKEKPVGIGRSVIEGLVLLGAYQL